jgi:hypothetical protein
MVRTSDIKTSCLEPEVEGKDSLEDGWDAIPRDI